MSFAGNDCNVYFIIYFKRKQPQTGYIVHRGFTHPIKQFVRLQFFLNLSYIEILWKSLYDFNLIQQNQRKEYIYGREH